MWNSQLGFIKNKLELSEYFKYEICEQYLLIKPTPKWKPQVSPNKNKVNPPFTEMMFLEPFAVYKCKQEAKSTGSFHMEGLWRNQMTHCLI